MKKFIILMIYLALISGSVIAFAACSKQNKEIEITALNADTKSVIDGNMKTYYEMNDGTWMCDDIIYQYRLEITGRMPNTAVDSTFIYLSNVEKISFEKAYKAAGISSNSEDYFSPEEAVLVEIK